MGRELDIVIPVYNEGDNIRGCLKRLISKVTSDFRIIVVYDFDADNTVPAVRQFLSESPYRDRIILLKNSLGRGALNAVKTGLEYSDAEFIVVTMADLSDPPEVINEMIKNAKDQGSDIVCGSRYMKGGSQSGGPLLKKVLSRLAGTSLHYFVGVPTHDVTNSFKLYRNSVVKQIQIESSGGFELGMEIVVKAWSLGFKVSEVPTTWEERTNGQSNFRLYRWLPKYLRWYLMCIGIGLRRMWFWG